MSRWTYYSPLVLGMLLVLAMNESLRAMLTMPEWTEWAIVAGVALVTGFQCQVLMIGAQGAFAQVLPVPFGKSVRGGSATLAGWLLIAWVVLSAVTVLLGFEAVTQAAVIVGIASLAALASMAVVYVWSLPAAVADFRNGSSRRLG